jgi:pyruvate dehydrogenase (quinone)
MLTGDLLSLRQLDLPVKVVGSTTVHRDSSSSSRNPRDSGTPARSSNIRISRPWPKPWASAPKTLPMSRPASPRALTHDGPVLVDAMVNRTELAMPPSITMEMARAFTLHMVKAVLNGGADAVIDLAKTNLWR